MLIPYFDAHCDTITEEKGLFSNGLAVDMALEDGLFAPRAQVFAVYGDADQHRLDGRFDCAAAALRSICLERDSLILCESAREVRQAAQKGQTAALLSVEGAEVLGCSPERLTEAACQGLFMTGITWNHANLLSGSCVEAPERGLSALGRQFVQAADRLKLLLDVSHLSPRGTADVLSLAPGRVLASHSNAFALCPHPRNLTDDQFRALVYAGGVAGITLYTPFLAENDRPLRADAEAGLAAVITHIRHLASLTPLGTAPIALGCDFDGCDRLPKGLAKSRDMGKLYEGLINVGFTKTEVNGIFYDNMFRFMQKSGKA